MKKTIKILATACMVLFLTSAPTAEAARRTEGIGWENCVGRSTVGTVKWGTSKLIAYRCSNGYVFSYVSSTAKKYKFASIANITPYHRTYQYGSGTVYSVVSRMTLLNSGHCYEAFGNTSENGPRSFKFCW